MALFKIEKGLAKDLSVKRPNTVEGWCYFTTDDGKFYIDIATGTGTTQRKAINAAKADIAIKANSADKLNVGTVGKETQPVYFKEGVPVVCEDLNVKLTETGNKNNPVFINKDGVPEVTVPFLPTAGGTLTGPLNLTENQNYGNMMPENAPLGRLFFVPKDDTEQLKDITVKLKGGVIGSGVIDTFKNIEVTATVQDDSHSHSNYVPSEGGFINGPIIRANEMGSAGSNNFGMIIGTAHENTGIMCGNGDADALTLGPTGKANLLIKSQWGVGFVDGASDNGITVGIDCRTGTLKANTVYGSIWNDYAEFRFCRDNFTPGQVVCENGDDSLSISSTRLQPGANIVSDTFGFAIGETDEAKCPIAVSGRVLAYPFEDRNSYNAGDPVCAGPGGTVSKMTREEVREYPDRVIGTVSAIPSYETWGSGNIKVNNRIWIKVN